MQILEQSTASQVVYVYLCDSSDGFTPEVSVTSPTVYLSKNGGAASPPNSLAWAEIDGSNMPGWYTLTLDATDTNTIGPLAIDVVKTGVSRHFAAVAYVSGSLLDDIKTDTAAILADTGTDGVVVPAATQAAIVDAVWDESIADHLGAGTTGAKLNSATASADPWSVELPGSYVAGEAGYEIARAIGGSGSGVGTVTVVDEDGNPVPGARVDIYTSATETSEAYFWTGGWTGTDGVYKFYGPAQTYYARRYKQGRSFTSDAVVVTVS